MTEPAIQMGQIGLRLKNLNPRDLRIPGIPLRLTTQQREAHVIRETLHEGTSLLQLLSEPMEGIIGSRTVTIKGFTENLKEQTYVLKKTALGIRIRGFGIGSTSGLLEGPLEIGPNRSLIFKIRPRVTVSHGDHVGEIEEYLPMCLAVVTEITINDFQRSLRRQ